MRSFSLARAGFLALLAALLSPGSEARASGFDEHPFWSAEGPQPGSRFGAAVASAGDLNGDSFPDLIVGAPAQDGVAGADCGAAFVFYGSATGLSATPGWTAEGEQPSAAFGAAVSSAGDVNGDGYGDVVIGSPGHEIPDSYPFRYAGRIYIYLGSAQGLSTTPTLAGDGMPYDLGYREGHGGTVTAGDFNGDGFSDVVGGQYATWYGAARVYYGSPTGPSLDNVGFMTPPGTYWGNAVAAADINGDGFDDLFVAGRHLEFQFPRSVVYLGSPTGLPPPEGIPPMPTPSRTFESWAGLAAAGDVDGDGFDDLLVEQGDSVSNVDLLAHVLYRGSPSGPVLWGDPSPILTAPGRLVPLGDVDGDGFRDAITQVGETLSFYRGTASGYRGISDGMSRRSTLAFATGDQNRDGRADLAMGDPARDRVDLYPGASDWAFGLTADLSLQLEPFFSFNIMATVTNQGPDAVRFRVTDAVPPGLRPAAWYCNRDSTGVMASCLYSRESGDEVDTTIILDPGIHIFVQLEFTGSFLPGPTTVALTLADWLHDPDPSNNQATVVLGPVEEPIFADGFESGDLGAWTPVGPGLAVTSVAALDGEFGLRVTASGWRASAVRDGSPAAERGYHARFRLDPRGFGRTPGRPQLAAHRQEAVLFRGEGSSGGAALFEILLRRSEGGLSLVARGKQDGGGYRVEDAPIADLPQWVDVVWRRASGPGTGDGALVVAVDDTVGTSLTGLDNDAQAGLEAVEWGLAPRLRPRNPGRSTVFLDAFASWRQP